ncbi:Ger(x)C family spore germination protein [Bacillus thermotolerans]|nr:Ger(x)C family spore germination protein [Bacillus thermotolerans]
MTLCMKKLLLLLSFSGALFLLGGCWDRTEINDLAIATSAAIDQKENDQIELSLEIFLPKAFGGGSAQRGQAGGQGITLVISQTGSNMAEALSKLQGVLPREIFWGHCKTFVFSEAVAKKGIIDHLDFLLRQPDIRERAYIFVSEKKARRILEQKTNLEPYTGQALLEQTDFGIGMRVTMQELDEMLISRMQSAALPYLKIKTQKKSEEEKFRFADISGVAVFRKDKMIGRLSEERTRGLLWLRDEIKGYTVSASPPGVNGVVSVNPVSVYSKMTPLIVDGKWRILLTIKTDGVIVQNSTPLDFFNPTSLASVEAALQDSIETRVRESLEKTQHQMKADVANFAAEFYREYPEEWKQVENHWTEKLPEVQVDVEAKMVIRSQGTLILPVDKKERGEQ